jgi:glutaminase
MKSPTKAKLAKIVKETEENKEGHVANYIPELAYLPPDLTAVCVKAMDKKIQHFENLAYDPITLQSTSKLIPLIGLLEEFGPEKVFSWVRVEPSGDDFASIARLDQFGPKPSNPMLNAGAITLCSHIPGEAERRVSWMANWVTRLFGKHLSINHLVLASEKNSGDRNRSLAYLLKSQGNLSGNVNETLDLYFSLCSYEAKVEDLIELPYILANYGMNSEGEPLSQKKQSNIRSRLCQHAAYIMNQVHTWYVPAFLPRAVYQAILSQPYLVKQVLWY